MINTGTDRAIQNSGWEIATSCDVELAPLFRDGKSFLNIDPQAIMHSLDVLAPTCSSGRLTFEAVRMEHPALSETRPDPAAGVAWHDRGAPSETHILVGVAGEPQKTPTSLKERFIACYREIARNVLGQSGILYSFQPLPEWRKPEEVQTTVTHELRHVADYQKPFLMKRQQRARRQVSDRLSTLYAATLSTPVVTVSVLETAHGVSNSLVWGAGVALTTVSVAGAQRLRRHIRRNFNKESPLERRAYATTATAQSLPPVISLQPMNS